MTAADFLSRLPGGFRETGRGQWQAKCPAHADKNPSLSIREAEDRILINCLARCKPEHVMAALGLSMADLFYKPNGHKTSFKDRIEKIYDYADLDGKVRFQTVRLKDPKDFRQRRPDGNGGYIWNLKGVEPILYHLPELVEAVKAGRRIFVVEGEKDCDNVRGLDLAATCNPMGGGKGKWRPEFSENLTGADVVIIPDADETGREHGEAVALALSGKAKSIRVLALPGPGKDASDWLSNGGNRAELERLAEAAPAWTPPPVVEVKGETPALPLPAEQINSYHRTDSGNAELFAALYGDRVRFDYKRQRWLLWSEHYWTQDCTGELDRLARELARVRYLAAHDAESERKSLAAWALTSESKTKRDATLDLARSELPIADNGENWDSDPWLLACSNGIMNLKTGELRPGSPADRITRHLDLAFDPTATAPRWQKFIREILARPDGGLDPELPDYLQRAVGYTLSGNGSEQVLFILWGKGANGKSTFLNTLRFVLGAFAVDTSFSTFELSARASIPADLAALESARMVSASETGENSKLNEARIKSLTGGDPVTCRRLYGDYFSYTPQFKLWLAVNHRPRVQDDSHAFWRRVVLLRFERTFAPEAEPGLAETLRGEAAGIMAWAIEGCREWQARGLKPIPEPIRAAGAEYQRDSDLLGPWLAECADLAECAECSAKEAYLSYKRWADAAGLREREQMTANSFGRRMRDRFDRVHRNSGQCYRGLRVTV